MTSRLQIRRDTTSNWTSNNPTLSSGEIGYETNTGLLKIGDGTSTFTNLSYIGSDYFRLTANGSAVGPTIADFFASGAYSCDIGDILEFEFYVNFLKSTAGTVTFTLTSSQSVVNLNATYIGSPATGIATVGNAVTAGIVNAASTANALPATASLTNAVNHQYTIKGSLEANATLASTFKLQVTQSAGTLTPLRGSYVRITSIPRSNYGKFA